MEGGSSVAKAVLACAELAEVFGRLGHDVVEELEDDPACRLVVDGDVELFVVLRLFRFKRIQVGWRRVFERCGVREY